MPICALDGCHKEFSTEITDSLGRVRNLGKRKYCSTLCRSVAANDAHLIRKQLSRKEVLQNISLQCRFCNENFHPSRMSQKFCSVICRDEFGIRYHWHIKRYPSATIDYFARVIQLDHILRSQFRDDQSIKKTQTAAKKATSCAARYAAKHPNKKTLATPRGTLTEEGRKLRQSIRAAARYAAKHPGRTIRSWIRRNPKPVVETNHTPTASSATDKSFRVFCRHGTCTDRCDIVVRQLVNGKKIILNTPKGWSIDMVDDTATTSFNQFIVFCDICMHNIK